MVNLIESEEIIVFILLLWIYMCKDFCIFGVNLLKLYL